MLSNSGVRNKSAHVIMIPETIPDTPDFAPPSWLTADLEKDPAWLIWKGKKSIQDLHRSQVKHNMEIWWCFGTKSQVANYKIMTTYCKFQSQIEVWPVVGYAEKNEPRTFDTPRPNNCSKSFRRIVAENYFYQQNRNLFYFL